MDSNKYFIYFPEDQRKVSLYHGLIVGNSVEADLIIESENICAQHLKFSIDSGVVYLESLSSFYSTTVNGEKVFAGEKYELSSCDIIQFGDVNFFFNAKMAKLKSANTGSFTGSLKLALEGATENGIQILRSTNEPVSLGQLRKSKGKLEELQEKINLCKKEMNKKDEKEALKVQMTKELEEFLSYLKAKKYQTESDIGKTIVAVKDARSHLDNELEQTVKKIKSLKKYYSKIVKELEHNKMIMSQLENDAEIIKGKNALAIDITIITSEINELEEEQLDQRLNLLEHDYLAQAQSLKEAQEEYANSKFGSGINYNSKKKKNCA